MKTFLIVTIFFVLLVAFAVVNANPSCNREIYNYVQRNSQCSSHGSEVQSFTHKLAEGKITYEELAEKIATACERANSSSCYNDISMPIAGSCNEGGYMQNIRNALKIKLTFNEYLCQNNGQKYLDFVKNGGAECFRSDEVYKCLIDFQNLSDLMFKEENVCTVFEADWACLHHYDSCENENVGIFYRQMLLLVCEKFGCSFNVV